MSNPYQQLVTYQHKDRKLFHIGVHDVSNVARGAVGITQSIGKARYVLNKAYAGEAGETHGFDSGFNCALMATHFEGWTDSFGRVYETIEQATENRNQVIADLEAKGWLNVGNRHRKVANTGKTGNRGWGKSTANLTMPKLRKVFDQMIKGMDFGHRNPDKVFNMVVNACIGSKSWIQYKGDIFLYIVEIIGQEEELLQAA